MWGLQQIVLAPAIATRFQQLIWSLFLAEGGVMLL